MTDRPQITLDWRRHWCARHLEPYRASWPTGAALAMVRLAQAALEDERIAATNPDDPAAALDAHAPLCCAIGHDRLRDLYETTRRQTGVPSATALVAALRH